MLSRAVAGLFAVAEAYPQLRATENFQQLQSSLSSVEDALQNARRYYNAVARDLNTSVQQFPGNLVANNFGFRSREFFEADTAERGNTSGEVLLNAECGMSAAAETARHPEPQLRS